MENRVKFIFFLLCILCISSLYSQSYQVQGVIVDELRQPVAFANVVIEKEGSATPHGTITDDSGVFSLSVGAHGAHTLRVSFIGYDTWHQPIDISGHLSLDTIVLSASGTQLDELVITANRQIISRVGGRINVNIADSRVSSGYSGLEVLQRLPSVIVNADGGVSLRNEVPVIMINGRISNMTGDGLSSYLASMSSDNIERIEIKTHLSADTDGESAGGVINIVLKRRPNGIDAHLRSSATLKNQGDHAIWTNANFNLGAGGFNLYGDYAYLYNEGGAQIDQSLIYHQLGSEIISSEKLLYDESQHVGQLGAVVDISSAHTIGAEWSTRQFENQNRNRSQLRSLMDQMEVETGRATIGEERNVNLAELVSNYEWKIDSLGSNLKVFGNYLTQSRQRDNLSNSNYDQAVFEDVTERNNGQDHTTIASGQADLKLILDKMDLKTGLKMTHTLRENSLNSAIQEDQEWQSTNRTSSSEYSEAIYAGYASLSTDMGERNYLEVGLRSEWTHLNRINVLTGDKVQQDYVSWFPSFSYVHQLSGKWSARLNYAKRLRRPSFRYLNNDVIKWNDFRYELGNPGLTPENKHNWELGISNAKHDLSAYMRITTNAINGIYFLEDQIAYYQKFNEGRQNQVGLSYTYNDYIAGWWHMNTTLNVFHRKYINERGEDSFAGTTALMNVANNIRIDNSMSIDVLLRYRSQYKDAFYITDPRYQCDLMIQKWFLDKRLQVRLYADDIFDLFEFREVRPFPNFISDRTEKWRTRRFRFWVGYHFKSKSKYNKRKNQSSNEYRRRL